MIVKSLALISSHTGNAISQNVEFRNSLFKHRLRGTSSLAEKMENTQQQSQMKQDYGKSHTV